MNGIIKTSDNITDWLQRNGYHYHHTACHPGYIRRDTEYLIQDYSGRFGVGYRLLRPRWDTTRYCYCDYYIKEEGKEDD